MPHEVLRNFDLNETEPRAEPFSLAGRDRRRGRAMMVDSTHRYMMERVAIDTIGAAMSNGAVTDFRVGRVSKASPAAAD